MFSILKEINNLKVLCIIPQEIESEITKSWICKSFWSWSVCYTCIPILGAPFASCIFHPRRWLLVLLSYGRHLSIQILMDGWVPLLQDELECGVLCYFSDRQFGLATELVVEASRCRQSIETRFRRRQFLEGFGLENNLEVEHSQECSCVGLGSADRSACSIFTMDDRWARGY